MKEISQPAKSVFLFVWTILLTSLTFVLGAIPLNGYYKLQGRRVYWWVFLSVAVGFYLLDLSFLALSLLVLTVTTGIYNEMRAHKSSFFVAGFISVFCVSVLSSFFVFTVKIVTEISWYTKLESFINQKVLIFLPPNTTANADLNIQQIIYQLPSAFVILITLSLFAAILTEKRLIGWLNIPLTGVDPLKEFALPEATIWVLIFSVLAAFIKTQMDWLNPIGMNLLNIVMLLYFFQGLAIISSYLKLVKASLLWRSLIYIFATIQLFVVVVVLGVADYWFNFRKKMMKRAEEVKN